MGDNSCEAVFNEVKRLMELRSMTIFLKYVPRLHGEHLFLEENKAEVQNKFEDIKLEAITTSSNEKLPRHSRLRYAFFKTEIL